MAGYLGNIPSAVPLTSADIADSIITSAKITDATIVNGDIANATIALAKLSATGTPSASTFLRGDNSWASAGATAGQVIQVLTATDSTERTTNSTSFVTASNTLSVTITPSSASNKIFLIVNTNLYSPNTSAYYFGTIFRDATDLGAASNKGLLGLYNATSDAALPLAMSILDSPNTTSAITYQVYIRNTTADVLRLNIQNIKGSITAFEIKG
jgi:hypothetical protein